MTTPKAKETSLKKIMKSTHNIVMEYKDNEWNTQSHQNKVLDNIQKLLPMIGMRVAHIKEMENGKIINVVLFRNDNCWTDPMEDMNKMLQKTNNNTEEK